MEQMAQVYLNVEGDLEDGAASEELSVGHDNRNLSPVRCYRGSAH